MNNEEYARYTARHMPRSAKGRNMLRAFLVGGAICALGQGITMAYTALGLTTEDAGTACAVTLIFLGAALTGFGVYDKLAKFAGAGTLVPITGFANAVASPALEFKTEGMVAGLAAKIFLIAGPVITFGILASAIYGVILLCI